MEHHRRHNLITHHKLKTCDYVLHLSIVIYSANLFNSSVFMSAEEFFENLLTKYVLNNIIKKKEHIGDEFQTVFCEVPHFFEKDEKMTRVCHLFTYVRSQTRTYLFDAQID